MVPRGVAVLLALLAPLAPSSARAEEPPAGLRCLARYYAVEAVREKRSDGDRWVLAIAGGGPRVPWDDGRTRSSDERLESPDGKDLYARRYRTGPIVPVDDPEDDPGRVRLDALLVATYPPRDFVSVEFVGHRVRFSRRAAAALARVSERLARAQAADAALRPYLVRLGGTVADRVIAGTDRKSAHAYGIAIDINDRRSHYWRWQKGARRWRNEIPQAIVDAFEAEGFIWGGRWYHYDTMHFEYRPELLDATCFPAG